MEPLWRGRNRGAIVTETSSSLSRCMPEVPARVVAIFAHPDDAEFTCGGTVAAWAGAGASVAYVVCTDGDKGGDDLPFGSEELAELRREEQREAAGRLGVQDVYFLGHPDGGLARMHGLEEELVGLIRQSRPELILAWDPWKRYQLHPDHRAAGIASLDAVMAAANPRMYPEQLDRGLTPHRTKTVYLFGAEEPDIWVDVSETFGAKLEAIALHRSQVRHAEELAGWMTRCNQEYGSQAGCAYAEAFKALKPFCQV